MKCKENCGLAHPRPFFCCLIMLGFYAFRTICCKDKLRFSLSSFAKESLKNWSQIRSVSLSPALLFHESLALIFPSSPPLCFYLLLCLHSTPSDFLYAFVLTHAIHARACTFKPYPFGSLHTLHPQCSHLEFSHPLISRVLFYQSNTSMSELKHTFHIHHTSPSLFLFFKASVLGLFLWPAPRLLCSFRNFGADSNILNQVQAATAARAPSLLVFHPTCWPQGVFVCRKGADNQATDNLSQEDFAACHIPFPPSLNSSLSIIFPLFSLQFVLSLLDRLTFN